MRDQSVKADGGKIRLELIPLSTLTSLGNVLTFGAEKYSENSWQNVEPERYIGALLRHFEAYRKDNLSIDKDSGLLHIECVLCNAAFLNDFAQAELKKMHEMADGEPKSQELELANWRIKKLTEDVKNLKEDVAYWREEAETTSRYNATLSAGLESMKLFLKEVNDVNELQKKEIEELKKQKRNA